MARAQQVLQGSSAVAAVRILPGVFVPGYTRDILISPDLLFASFSPRLSSPRSVRVRCLFISLFICPYLLLSLFFHRLPFNIVPTINSLQLRDEFFESDWQICERRALGPEYWGNLAEKSGNGDGSSDFLDKIVFVYSEYRSVYLLILEYFSFVNVPTDSRHVWFKKHLFAFF